MHLQFEVPADAVDALFDSWDHAGNNMLTVDELQRELRRDSSLTLGAGAISPRARPDLAPISPGARPELATSHSRRSPVGNGRAQKLGSRAGGPSTLSAPREQPKATVPAAKRQG